MGVAQRKPQNLEKWLFEKKFMKFLPNPDRFLSGERSSSNFHLNDVD
jgi:hypothetical protein